MKIPDNLLLDKKVFEKYFKEYFKECFSSFSNPISYDKLIKEQLRVKPIKKGYNQWYNKRNKITRGLVKFSVKDDYTVSMNITDKKVLVDDSRYNIMLRYFQETLDYCKKHKLKVPNTDCVVFFADRYPFELDMEGIQYPMFCYATIKNKKYPLLPDNTFLEFSFEKRMGKGVDWDTSKKIFNKKNYKKPKSDKLYFRGKDTTLHRTDLRKILYKIQDKKKMKILLLEGDVKYVPMYKFSYFKYLLDLPGHYEWSNRFPRLFLCNRLVVKLSNDIKQYSDEEEYIAFADLLMRPNVDFLNYFVSLNEVNKRNRELRNENVRILKREQKKILNKLNNMGSDDYNKICKSGNERINQLTNEHLYLYLYYGIIANNDFLSGKKNQEGGKLELKKFKELLNNGREKKISKYRTTKHKVSKAMIKRMWNYYHKNRVLSERIFFTSDKIFKDTKIAIIVPYMDNDAQERAPQLKKFIEHFKKFLKGLKYQIFIIEQSQFSTNKYGGKFNRGKILNIGIQRAINLKYNVIIAHDVDIYPKENMLPYYTCIPKYPNHIGNVWKTKYTKWEFVGGIMSMTPEQLKKTNGYPNDFWGWGGEDDALYNRITKTMGKILKPDSGNVNEWEHNNTPPDKVNIEKKENILSDLINWKKDGLNSLKFYINNIEDFGEKREKVKIDDKTMAKIKEIYKDDYNFINSKKNNKLKKTVQDDRYYTLKSDKYKKIFFWNAKAGCTTLKTFIFETENNKKFPRDKNIHSYIGQKNKNKYYVKMTPENLKKYKNYEKVLLFREPIDRLYSFYKDKVLIKQKDNFIKNNRTNIVSPETSFSKFVDRLEKIKPQKYQHHLHLQTSGINRKWIDKIITLKDLNEYLKKLAKYETKSENLSLGKTNITKINVDI